MSSFWLGLPGQNIVSLRYVGRRLTGHHGRTSAVRGPMRELSAHVLRAHSCRSGGLWLAIGSCCAPEVNLDPEP